MVRAAVGQFDDMVYLCGVEAAALALGAVALEDAIAGALPLPAAYPGVALGGLLGFAWCVVACLALWAAASEG